MALDLTRCLLKKPVVGRGLSVLGASRTTEVAEWLLRGEEWAWGIFHFPPGFHRNFSERISVVRSWKGLKDLQSHSVPPVTGPESD